MEAIPYKTKLLNDRISVVFKKLMNGGANLDDGELIDLATKKYPSSGDEGGLAPKHIPAIKKYIMSGKTEVPKAVDLLNLKDEKQFRASQWERFLNIKKQQDPASPPTRKVVSSTQAFISRQTKKGEDLFEELMQKMAAEGIQQCIFTLNDEKGGMDLKIVHRPSVEQRYISP